MARRQVTQHSGAGARTSMALLLLIGVLIVIRSGVTRLGQKVEENVREQVIQHQSNAPSSPPPASEEAPPERTLGEEILKGYGDEGKLPHEDIIRMAHAISNFALLVKGDDPLPLGSNEELALALRGKNNTQFRFLPDDHPAFNAQGQLVDRWGVPLFFHAAAHDRLDIRSAGPDKTMWTEDDLHRRYDGRFLRGEELNAASLIDAKPEGR